MRPENAALGRADDKGEVPAMAYYRRRHDSTIGWLLFCIICFFVFCGLIVAVYFAKKYNDKREEEMEAQAAAAKAAAKDIKPVDIVRLHLSKKTKEEGKGYQIERATEPKE